MTTEQARRARAAIGAAFPPTAAPPPISLRAGNALDDYAEPPPFDPEADAPTDAYIEAYYHGIHFLDAPSWRHYLPVLLEYVLSHEGGGGPNVVETLLFAIAPGDPSYPVFPVLDGAQIAAVEGGLRALHGVLGAEYAEEIEAALCREWPRGPA